MTDVIITRLSAGDALTFDGHDRRIVTTIDLTVDGGTWAEHRLIGRARAGRLTVAEGDGHITYTAWTENTTMMHDLRDRPGSRELTVNARTFARHEEGEGTYAERGGTHGCYTYADYESSSELLSFEQYDGGSWQASNGRRLANAFISTHKDI